MDFGLKKTIIILISSALVIVLAFSVTFNTVGAVLSEGEADTDNTDNTRVIESNDDYDLIIGVGEDATPGNDMAGEPEIVEDRYVIEIIEEEYVPKAMRDEEHSDSALHFLIPAAALLVQIYYIWKRKNNQREIFELRKKLALCRDD